MVEKIKRYNCQTKGLDAKTLTQQLS